MSYQVIKHFGDYQAGTVLTEDQFLNQRRISVLVEQRYIQPVADEPDVALAEATERVAMVVPRSVTIKRKGGRK